MDWPRDVRPENPGPIDLDGLLGNLLQKGLIHTSSAAHHQPKPEEKEVVTPDMTDFNLANMKK